MDGNLRKSEWRVRDVEAKEARALIEAHHYARGASNTWSYLHGLFHIETDRLHGVAWWLPPTGPAAKAVDHQWKLVLSLSRLAVLPETPKNACSFLLSRSVRLIAREGRFRTLVTFACESQGHLGTIYEASNWQYTGQSQPQPRWLDPATGKQVAPKATVNRTRQQMIDLGYELQGRFKKRRYVAHLGHGMEVSMLKLQSALWGAAEVYRGR